MKKKELLDIFEKVKTIFERENKKILNTTKDNNYILFFSISGVIETLFNFLKSQSNQDADILTKLLELLIVIISNPKYMTLINECKGFNQLIDFLFKTESDKSKEKKLAINLT